jgi:HK97 family phage major capsid protein
MSKKEKKDEKEEVQEDKAKEITDGIEDKIDKLIDAKLGETLDKQLEKHTRTGADGKNKIYSSKLSKSDVDKMDWKEKGAHFVSAIARGDREKLDALSEGTDAEGGYLVPEEYRQEIVKRAYDQAMIRPRARVIPMSTDTLNMPTSDSGPKVYWTAEAASKTTTSAQFGQFTLTALKMAAIMVTSDELNEDSTPNVIEYLTDEFASVIAEEEDKVFTSGNGSTEPAGLDSYSLGTIDAGGDVKYDHFVDAIYALKQAYRQNAVWICHQQVLAEIQKLQDDNGRPLLLNLNAKENPMILGRPVLEVNSMDTTKIFVGDLSKYIIGDRSGMTMRTSQDAYVGSTSMFQTDQTAIRVVKRLDAGLPQTEAFKEIQNVQA